MTTLLAIRNGVIILGFILVAGFAVGRLLARWADGGIKPLSDNTVTVLGMILAALFGAGFMLGGWLLIVRAGEADLKERDHQRQHCERLDLAYIDGECRKVGG